MIQGGKDTVQVVLPVLIYSNLAKLWKEQQVPEGSSEHDKEQLWKNSEQSRMVTNPKRNKENKREHHRIERNRRDKKEKEYCPL
jgi:hypothetical protein